MNNIKTLCYDRIDVSEEINIDKTTASKECNKCQYWYFLDKVFKFQPNICNGCRDVLMMSMILNGIAILNINGADYHCIITRISKSETKYAKMQNNAKYRFE